MDNANKGWLYAGIGVIIFAGSLPATQMAVIQLSPWLVTALRGTIAGGIALVLLWLLKQPRPSLKQLTSLIIIAGGVVFGFPLLTALALKHVSSAHSVVFLGLLPMCTAIFSALREKLLPSLTFWLFALIGSACVVGFAVSHISSTSLIGDVLMLVAVVVCGLGYAEGAILSRQLGGWQVICWALTISLPLMLPFAVVTLPSSNFHHLRLPTLAGLTYVTLFSMLIGFFFWYQGLALGNTANISQLQLLQPFIALGLSALILGDTISSGMIMVSLGTLCCIMGIKRYG